MSVNEIENVHTEDEDTRPTIPIGQLWAGSYERGEPRSHRRPPSPFRARRFLALALIVSSLGGASVVGTNAQRREENGFTVEASADRSLVNEEAALAAEQRAEQRADRSRRVTPPPSPAATVQAPATRVAPKPTRPPAPKPAPKRSTGSPNGVVVGGNAATVVSFAKAQVGKPYVYGATGPNSYDCSGLVLAAYARIGIKLPHSTYSQIKYGRAVSQSQLVPGDLVFSNGTGHVSIYIGGGQVVHASTPSTGVKISKIYDFEAGRRLVG